MSLNHEEPLPISLTLDQTRAFDDVLAVFTSPGWRILQAELISSRDRFRDVRNASKGLDFALGQLDVLETLANWPDLWRNLYEGAQAGTIEVSPEFGA